MKTSDEIRGVAWTALMKGGWIWKVLLLWLVFTFIGNLVEDFVGGAEAWAGIDDWLGYPQQRLLQAAYAQLAQVPDLDPGLVAQLKKAFPVGKLPDVTDPAIYVRWTVATLVHVFFLCVIAGLAAVAYARTWLFAARGHTGRWLNEAMSVSRYPCSLAALFFLRNAIVVFLSLFLWLPGYWASYCFQCAYFLKADHPDWGAWKCLAASHRLMKGNKWRAFKLDWSYWRIVTWAMVPLLGISLLLFPLFNGSASVQTLSGTSMTVCWVVSAVLFWITGHYLGVGHAEFYRELVTRQDAASSSNLI